MLMPFLRDKGECVKYFRSHTRMIIVTYVNLSQLINAYSLCERREFDFEMNFDDRCQYANNAKTQENSEYGKSEVRCSTSRNTQCELFMSQKGFLLCESCLWCASSLYRIEDEDG